MNFPVYVDTAAVVRRNSVSASPMSEVVSSSSQPRSRFLSSSSEGVPSVVLSGPLHLSVSASQSKKKPMDMTHGNNTGRRPEDDVPLQHKLQGVSHITDMWTPRKDESTLTERYSPTWASGYLRSPSVAGGRCEEATEAQVGPGYFSPTSFQKNSITACNIANVDSINNRGPTSVNLLKDMDEVLGSSSVDGSEMRGDLWEKAQKEPPRGFSNFLSSHEERLFVNRTNENNLQHEKEKIHSIPDGINTSHWGQQHERRFIQWRKNNPCFYDFGREQQPHTDHSPLPPSRFTTCLNVAFEGKSKGRQAIDLCNKNVHGKSKSSRILDDDSQCKGEAGEEPVLLSTLLDQGWGRMCEEEAMRWKRSCSLAEQQLAVVSGRETDFCPPREAAAAAAVSSSSSSATAAPLQRRYSSSVNSKEVILHGITRKSSEVEDKHYEIYQVGDTVKTFTSGEEKKEKKQKVEEEEGRRKGVKELTNRERCRNNTLFVEAENYSGAPMNKTEDTKYCVSEEECARLKRTVAQLQSERDGLKEELNVLVFRNENLETSLIAKEEMQVSQREEWLAQEAVLKKKQEQLAVALRQVYRYVSSTAEEVEHKKSDLREARARCCALETELAEAKAEVLALKEDCAKRLEEDQRLRKQLDQLETEVRLLSGNTGVDSSSEEGEEDADKDNSGDSSAVNAALRDVMVQRLRRVLVAVQRGESRRGWIVSQLRQAFRCLGETPFHNGELFNVDASLQELVHSLEGLLDFSWKGSVVEEEKCGKPSELLHNNDDSGPITTLLRRAQECVSRLAAWAPALQRQHLELKEELEVVRADRNELVGQQSAQVRRLQQEVIRAEEEKTRLMFLVEERDGSSRQLNELGDRAVASVEEKTAVAKDPPYEEPQATGNKMVVLHSAQYGDLERLAEHMTQQAEEFGRSLHALFVETLETVTRAEERGNALEEQLLRLCGEREVSQRVQDERLDILRAQLAKVQTELADRNGALRMMLQSQLQKNKEVCQEQSVKEVVESPKSLKTLSTLHQKFSTSPLLLVNNECGGIPFVDSVVDPFEVSFHTCAIPCRDDEVTPSHSTNGNSATRRMQTSSPSDFALEEQQQQQECYFHHDRESTQQYSSVLTSGTNVRSWPSTHSSVSQDKKNNDEHNGYGFTVQRGVMRKHQEIWTRQAELMGLVADEK